MIDDDSVGWRDMGLCLVGVTTGGIATASVVLVVLAFSWCLLLALRRNRGEYRVGLLVDFALAELFLVEDFALADLWALPTVGRITMVRLVMFGLRFFLTASELSFQINGI